MSNLLDAINPRELGQRLQAARKARKLTQEDVADQLGLARTTLVAIEKGERKVRPLEFARMAELYNRPASELLAIASPDGGFTVQLRGASGKADFDEELAAVVEEFQELSAEYVRLEKLRSAPLSRRYPPVFDISGVEPETAAEDVAVSERNRLGLGDAPVLNLRAILENDVGIRVFYIDMPSKIAGMFAYTEAFGGCVAVNRKHPAERRRLSLAHEYGHFLTRRDHGDVTIIGGYQRVPRDERFANAFASALLMPASGLSRRFNDLRRSRQTGITPADLCRLAHLYFVSVEAITRRLEALGLLKTGTWDKLHDKGFRVREAQELLDLPPQPIADQTVPTRHLCLAVEAYQQGMITEGQFARALRVDRLEARRLASLIASADVNEQGHAAALLSESIVN